MEIGEAAETSARIRAELEKVIVGQADAVQDAVVALVGGGHLLLEGPPGTAKTLLARTAALTVQGSFRRVQFTPDLMPTDIVGVNVFRSNLSAFEFQPGPIFGDIVLADEINRAPAKTQSALLEAMQERQVSVDGQTYPMSRVFSVFATQNPIEYEGTYPLPEAQLDRFLLKTLLEYPSEDSENDLVRRHQEGFDPSDVATFGVTPVTTVESVAEIREAARRVRVADSVLRYATRIVRHTRALSMLTLGASPRASVMLLAAARALALLRGREFVTPDDVRDMARPALRHRVVVAPEADIEGTTADQCIGTVLDRVEVPRL